MTRHDVLHILRNPHGHGEQAIRAARLAACDEIERLERELAEYKARAERAEIAQVERSRLGKA